MKEFIKEKKNSYSFCKITFKLLCTKGEKISNIFPRLFSEKLSRISGKKRKKKTHKVCYATQILSTLGINQLEQLELIRL